MSTCILREKGGKAAIIACADNVQSLIRELAASEPATHHDQQRMNVIPLSRYEGSPNIAGSCLGHLVASAVRVFPVRGCSVPVRLPLGGVRGG